MNKISNLLLIALAFVAGSVPAANTNDVTVTFDSTNKLFLRLWVPDGVSKIRGVIVTTHPSGNPGYTQDYRPSADYTNAWNEVYTTDYDSTASRVDLALQLVAQRHAFALVGLCFQDQKPGGITATTSSVANVSMMPAHAAALEAGMNLFAAQFNRPELTNAPIATYGFSGGSGFTAYYAAYNPGRCIAFAHNKGGSIGDYDPVFMEAAEQVPAMLCYGEIDTPDRIDTINTVFSYHRAKGAPWALIPDYGLGHDSQGYGRFLGAAFLDRVIEMRLPRDWMPGGAAPVLRPLAEDSGWLGDNTTWESDSSTIVSFTASAAPLSEKRAMSWLPDWYLAEAWRSVTTHFPPVKLSSPVSALATTRPKQLAYLLAGAGQSMALNATSGSVSSVDWKNGDALVHTELSAPFSTTLSAVTGGLHLIHGELQMTNGSSRPSDLAVLLVKPTANQTPTILSGPAVAGAPTSGVPVSCSVRAGDPDGGIEELLAYTWSATGPGAVVFGSGNGSNAGKDIAAVFPVDGFYVLKVVVKDANAAAVTSSADVVVGDVSTPSAGFSVSPNSGWVPLTVSFTDTSFGVITNRYWDFGDGAVTNTTATNVTHTYTTGGTNTVQLIVSGPDGISTNMQVAAVTVMVPVPPTAIFTASPISGTAPLAVTFTDTSTGTITNRFWSFGDGGTTNTTATSVPHTYTVAGTNTVQLIVSGPAGVSTNIQANLIRVATALSGTLLLEEHFNYVTTNLSGNAPVTGGTWGGGGSSVVLGSGLGSPGGFAAASGSEIKIGTSGAAQTNQFATINSGTIYMSYLIQFNSLRAGGVMMWGGLSLNGGAEYAQLQYTNTAGNSYYQLGLGGRSTAAGTNAMFPAQFTVGQTQLVVVAYTFVSGAANDIVSLWINPNSSTFGAGSAPSADLMQIASSEAGSLNTIDIKNSSTLPANTILDEMRVGTNWASVVPAAISAPSGDTDSDGIPDEWELQYFGGVTNADSSALSANGINTIYETYIAGLNPTNPSARFSVSNERNVLGWSATSGRVYSVYWTTNLLNGFQPLETNIVWPQNSWTSFLHEVQAGGFYRINVQLIQ